MNIRAIINTHLAGIADAIAKDIVAALVGATAAPRATQAKKTGPKARAPRPKAGPKARKTRAPQAPTAAVTDQAAAIGNFVQENPGSGAEAIRSGTGIAKPAWARAAKAAVAGGAVRTEGQKRAMKYYPVGEAAE